MHKIHYLENAGVYRISLFGVPQGVAGLEFPTMEQAQSCLKEAEEAFKAGLDAWSKMVGEGA